VRRGGRREEGAGGVGLSPEKGTQRNVERERAGEQYPCRDLDSAGQG